MKLLLVGSTGLVGRQVLAQALAHPRIEAVVAPVRRPLADAPGLLAPLVDFNALPPDAAWWQADAVICTLGTTMRIAGSRPAFRRVDHDYPLAVARLARQHGTPTFVLNSALGADAASHIFYNRIKGETERDLATLGFDSLSCVRPGLIAGQRDEYRPAERIGLSVLTALGPLLPRRWRKNPAERVAQRLIEAAIEAPPGTHVVMAEQMA